MATSRKTGKKGRKINRAARKPAHARYVSQRRWETNKERRRRRHLKRVERKRLHLERRAALGKV